MMGEVMGAIIARRLYRPVTKGVAGPTGSPIGAEEVVASGASAAPHVSGPGRHRWAPDALPASADFGVTIVGPGATVGTVETRVPRAGCQGPPHSSEDFAKDQALQACRASPGFFPLRGTLQAWRASRGVFPREGFSSRGHLRCHRRFC